MAGRRTGGAGWFGGAALAAGIGMLASGGVARGQDPVRALQEAAILQEWSPLGFWGTDPETYINWSSHSNRLIPVYTFGTKGAGAGLDLTSYQGENSPYRDQEKLRRIFGYVPTNTVNPQADYLDQTNIADIQLAAVKQGKKHVVLVVFDGTDWHVTRAAAIVKSGKVAYDSGRGSGLHIQDYTAGGTTQFGWMCTTPHNDGTYVDVDRQLVRNPGGRQRGGYDVSKAGLFPWSVGDQRAYLIGKPATYPAPRPSFDPSVHAYTDSSSSACSMTAALKTYNNAINVDPQGRQVLTVPHLLQAAGWSIGVVTSVPISHATPAAAYAHNVDRDDYQDLSRDMLGLPSISHPKTPLAGVDVLIGTGWGQTAKVGGPTGTVVLPPGVTEGQGKNFVPGNVYLTDADRAAVDVSNGGPYVVAERTAGRHGVEVLWEAGRRAIAQGKRLFGFFGFKGTASHLPFATANGDYAPTFSKARSVERYTPADLDENPTLADFAQVALDVLAERSKPNGGRFWLMVEAGDVDWGCHTNNIDNAIGAVLSGDRAVRAVTDWVEKNSNWDETIMIVTSDHGHSFYMLDPKLLLGGK